MNGANSNVGNKKMSFKDTQDEASLSMDWFCPRPAVHATMKSALSSLTSERERLRQCVDYETCPPTSPQVVGLKNTLATVC